MKKLLTLFSILVVIITIGYITNLLPALPKVDLKSTFQKNTVTPKVDNKTENVQIVNEESAIIASIDRALPSVVTIGISTTASTRDRIEINPFDPFSPFRRIPGEKRKIEQNIGSGFIISEDGLVVTNKHVVADTEASYQVLTNDDKKFDVQKIYRDPLNDLAILRIQASGLKPIEFGDSSSLKLGQIVIAIGTPLGEFKNTVTQGIISGLGRGITAGSPFEEFVERLDNVIQTDAAINPGNSGGPLINLKGQAIGVNTAVSQEGQNIGFAIPIDIARNLIKQFNDAGGNLQRPYIGVRYQMIGRQQAILNEIPEGAYITEVIENSPAEESGLQPEDIITEFDGKRVRGEDDQTLQKLILEKKVGDRVTIQVWRNGETLTLSLTLGNFE